MTETRMNETIKTFGYPTTLIKEYAHWVVLLRPAQVTLGSLVLAAKSDATALHDLPQAAFTELKQITTDIETTLMREVGYERLNYLMLMMVDPHVHYHVLPRYPESRQHGETQFKDHGWPGPPTLGEAVKPDAQELEDLVGWLRSRWPRQD